MSSVSGAALGIGVIGKIEPAGVGRAGLRIEAGLDLEPPRAGAPRAAVKTCSVLVLTKNEEANIEECLMALSFSDDVVVLDSFSTDRTVEIARRFPNVRVIQRAFDTEFMQRNHGLHEVAYRNDWVYVCDADERVTPALAAEITAKINEGERADAPVAYRMRYRNMFMGRWIRHASSYPVFIIRLVKPSRVRYETRETNVHPIIDGAVGELREYFLHYSFNKGLRAWFTKHNYYSDREALEAVRVRSSAPCITSVLSKDPMVRRRTLKNLSFFLPARQAWRFVHDFVIKGGFRDGLPGVHYCLLIAMYEYWIGLKIREREHNWKGRNEDIVARLLAETPVTAAKAAARRWNAATEARVVRHAPASPTYPAARPAARLRAAVA
ncbi:MAG: glycosyltransferase family 2 protein [Phycisphaerales bacterium]|nr:glycosyltransferase family 2 protein [Phycisphaerales bacterium]